MNSVLSVAWDLETSTGRCEGGSTRTGTRGTFLFDILNMGGCSGVSGGPGAATRKGDPAIGLSPGLWGQEQSFKDVGE